MLAKSANDMVYEPVAVTPAYSFIRLPVAL